MGLLVFISCARLFLRVKGNGLFFGRLLTRPMDRADTPSCWSFGQDHGFSCEIIDPLAMKLPGDVKGARDPRDITFLPNNHVALCAWNGATISDVFGEMFALILVSRLNGATFDDQGVGLKQRHHLVGLSGGERFVKVFRGGGDRRCIGRDWFAAGNAGCEDETPAREQSR